MVAKISKFIELTTDNVKFNNRAILVEKYLDDVISISFPNKRELKFSINFGELDTDDDDVDLDEASIIYRLDGQLLLYSGSIEEMIVELNELL